MKGHVGTPLLFLRWGHTRKGTGEKGKKRRREGLSFPSHPFVGFARQAK